MRAICSGLEYTVPGAVGQFVWAMSREYFRFKSIRYLKSLLSAFTQTKNVPVARVMKRY